MGLTVAVTGPTGEIGISTVDALERDRLSNGSPGWPGGPSTPSRTA